MRRLWVLLPALAVAGAWLFGARGGEPPRASTPRAPAVAAVAAPEEVESPAAAAPEVSAPAPIDVRRRMLKIGGEDLAQLEEELEARLREDPAFMGELLAAFLTELDPVKQSFLVSVMASEAPIRNAPEWQDKLLRVAEFDTSLDRRIASLAFLQEAEAIRTSVDRLLALAENDRELCIHALAALKGMPERRLADPRVAELAGRIADREPDPTLRGIALRVEENSAHAVRFLADADRIVRMQACRVVSEAAAIEAALLAEADPEVREAMQQRLEALRNP